MASYCQIIVVGNLGRDPDLRYTPGGTAVLDVSIAVSRKWKDKATNANKEETCWVPVTMFGRTAEVCSEYCRKGSSILVSGYFREDSWADKETGQKRSKLKVICENLQLLGDKGGKQKPSADYGEEPQAAPGDSGDDVPF